MADPQRRLYALFRSRLPESVPAEGAIIQYANGIVDFQSERASAAVIALRAVRSTFRASTGRQPRLQMYAVR